MFKGAMELGKVFKQAKQMQEQMEKVHADLGNKTVTGTAGAGAVEVVLSGHYRCNKITISPDAAKESQEILSALIAAAYNDAADKVEELKNKELQAVAGDLNMPAGFKLPF